jgi:hypothetical protein
MVIEKVTWHLEGVRALRDMLNMLTWAAEGCKVTAVPSACRRRIGLELDQRFWIGMVYKEAELLLFQTERCRINVPAARQLAVGRVLEDDEAPGGFRWRRAADLTSESVHFFARGKVSQMDWLEGFLQESLNLARQIAVSE